MLVGLTACDESHHEQLSRAARQTRFDEAAEAGAADVDEIPLTLDAPGAAALDQLLYLFARKTIEVAGDGMF